MPRTTPTRLRRVDPGDLAKFFALFAFVLSLPPVVLALLAVVAGRAVYLKGVFSYRGQFHLTAIIAYPFVNALGGLLAGFLLAWLYNALARCFGGVRISLGE
ncbi:MAG: hypothetical protein ABII82_11050 [Verrucomicrobiota bacterium]